MIKEITKKCRGCNLFVGLADENIETLQNAIIYLGE